MAIYQKWKQIRVGHSGLTPVKAGTGTTRLLDMIRGRSEAVLKTWLAELHEQWKQVIGVVAMDGFTGFKTDATEEPPQAVGVLDPFHVVKLGPETLDAARRRVQREQYGRRSRKNEPLYKCRRTLTIGLSLAAEKQKHRVEDLFDVAKYEPVQLVWSV